MDLKKLFGQNVKKYRKALGYTQMQVADMLNVDQKHISFIESGNSFPSAALIAKISEKLQVAPSKLFESTDLPSVEELKNNILYIIEKSTYDELEKIHNYASGLYISKR